MEISYDPPPLVTPSCLYASVLYIAGEEPTRSSIAALREEVRSMLEQLLAESSVIADYDITVWSQVLGITPAQFVESTTGPNPRNGTTLDIWLCSMIMGNTYWLVDEHGDVLFATHVAVPRM
eukprot:3082172-Amphidinium_carterae.1